MRFSALYTPLRFILGTLLIVLGVAALFTPLTPGSWLALIGLELVGAGFVIPKRVRKALRERWERIKIWWRERSETP